MDNPNEYNDDDFSRYSMEVDEAIGNLWEAGADLSNIEDVIGNAIENATGSAVRVSIGNAR